MSTCLTVENAQSHVTAFQPISEAARSWSDDNARCQNKSSLDYTPTNYVHRSMTTIQANLRLPAPPVNNWRILLVQSFTAHMPLLTATSSFGLERRRWSSPQQC